MPIALDGIPNLYLWDTRPPCCRLRHEGRARLASVETNTLDTHPSAPPRNDHVCVCVCVCVRVERERDGERERERERKRERERERERKKRERERERGSRREREKEGVSG